MNTVNKLFFFFIIGSIQTIYADCTDIPSSNTLSTAIESKNIDKSKGLLEVLKKEMNTYLETCDKDKKMFEELNIQLLTFKDKVSDLEENKEDINSGDNCSILPSRAKLEKAFNTKNYKMIESLYLQYQKDTELYIKYCAFEPEYAMVYESAMLCDEKYEEYKKARK